MITSITKQDVRLDEQIIRLYLSGGRAERISDRLGLPRDRVNRVIADHKAKARAEVPAEGLLHPWLDADDEANVHRCWVPSPDDLNEFYEQQRKLRGEVAALDYLEMKIRTR